MNSDKKMERLTTLEAALYAAGRPIDIDTLKLAVGTKSDKMIMKLINELGLRYNARQSALEVRALTGKRAVMRLREKFDGAVKRFSHRPLLTSGPLKTLSYIAYHQPVEQMRVIADRGTHVYSHLKMMEEMGLITRERINGRGYLIETTPYFADYFGFGQDPLKSKLQLRKMFSTMKIHKLENGNGGDRAEEIMTNPFTDGQLDFLDDTC